MSYQNATPPGEKFGLEFTSRKQTQFFFAGWMDELEPLGVEHHSIRPDAVPVLIKLIAHNRMADCHAMQPQLMRTPGDWC